MKIYFIVNMMLTNNGDRDFTLESSITLTKSMNSHYFANF